MCHSADETVSHIVSGCQKLAQKQYKRRHDNVAKAIHWDILGRCGFDRKQKWYEHMPECQVENDKFKILWDFSIRTDNEIQARRPDLVVIDKEAMTCKIIDVAIPEDTGVQAKEDEKVQKYQDLAREIRKMWGMRTQVIPVVMGALGTVPKRLEKYLESLGVRTPIELIQRTALLGTARILRQVIEIT